MPRTHDISDFWNWFESNSDQIRDAYHEGGGDWLCAELTPRVQQLAERLNWEIGPYHDPDDTFVLSPTIRENLPVTRAAVVQAPRIDGWRFLPAKPRKTLSSLTFTARECTINADDWRYRLISYNQGEFVDIELFINSFSGFPAAHENLFCELVVQALLGEELRLERVGYLLPSIVENNLCIEKSTAIQHLRDHLAQVLKPDSCV